MTGVLRKQRDLDTDAHTHTEHHVKMKREIRVMLLQAEEHQKLSSNHQKLRKSLEQILLHRTQNQPC